jgi:hypothetical protein
MCSAIHSKAYEIELRNLNAPDVSLVMPHGNEKDCLCTQRGNDSLVL